MQEGTFLIRVGYGRAGRWEGWSDLAVDKETFELVQSISDEYDDDDLFDPVENQEALAAALAIMSGALDDIDVTKEIESAMSKIKKVENNPPYFGVHNLMIWNTYT